MNDERANKISSEAIKLAPEDCDAYLDEQCGDDADLRAEVDQLVLNHSLTVKDQAPQRIAGEYQSGDTVGHFTIRDRLGAGGMGDVYLAEQSVPVKRQVAFKVIKPGFDTRSTLARFQAERQALARMDHPYIAKVLEAGATETGRPWFAMEYIKGQELLEYCDENKLNTRQRLKLFIKICEAIQHAHQKGIMHRDLKPGNILVSRGENDEPQPKVIDFGIAKAISSDLTDMTLHTVIGQLVGTLTYMSPEQVRGSDDIDTRTDVYSLGVILYKMISGQVPFSGETISASGQEAMKKSIRELDPPKPSTQLSSIDVDQASAIAQLRRTDTGSLRSTLRRELEWIPLKALRKDRGERYASADDLAQDVQRYLDGEALKAGPVTRLYRLRKFVKRNKVSVITAASFVLVLIAAMVVALVLLAEAERQRFIADPARDEAEQETARAEAVKDFVTTMLSSVNPKKAGSMDKELMKLVLSEAAKGVGAKFEDQPLVEPEIRGVIGSTYMALGQYNEAKPHLVEALTIYRKFLGDEHPDTLRSIYAMGVLLRNQGKYEEATPYNVEALETRRRVLGDEHPDTLWSLNAMGSLLKRQGKYEEAMPYFTEALEAQRRVQGDEHPDTLGSIGNMGHLLSEQGKYEEAMPYCVEAMEGYRRVRGNEHPDTLISIGKLGTLLSQQGKYEEAMPYNVEALETRRRVLGDEHPATLVSINSMGWLLLKKEKYEKAMSYFTEALETSRRVLGDEHPDTLYAIRAVGYVLSKQGKYEEAMPYYTEALEIQRRVRGDEHPRTLWSITALAELHDAWHEAEPEAGHDAKAAEYRQMLEEIQGANATAESATP
ncbi:MAG: tetratricopeptide repeat protein [Planctomycetota bacterium]|nr:tetratricopeptide repeat protein [Planctomycetota bacterium]